MSKFVTPKVASSILAKKGIALRPSRIRKLIRENDVKGTKQGNNVGVDVVDLLEYLSKSEHRKARAIVRFDESEMTEQEKELLIRVKSGKNSKLAEIAALFLESEEMDDTIEDSESE